MRLRFYYDLSCPYAYLASTRIEAIAAERGAELEWKPMLLGGVLRAVGGSQNASEDMVWAKAEHNLWDVQRWADRFGVPLNMPAGHPIRTVRALRALIAAPEARWPQISRELYHRYWVTSEDISQPDVVGSALTAAGCSPDVVERCLAANDDLAIKDQLRARTDEALSHGIFGAPSMVVGEGPNEHLLWGQDRLGMLQAMLGGWDPDGAEPGPGVSGGVQRRTSGARGPAEIDFWYDFSSPFAYLASTQIERIAEEAGARLNWRPMLLGAVFREVGNPDVPLNAMGDARRRYFARELASWACYWGVPFRFTSRFPMRTVTALRLALLAEDSGRLPDVSHRFFRALWVENRDLNDADTLVELLDELGSPGAEWVASASDEAVKNRLFAATRDAVDAGVFGAPTMVVRREGKSALFWGQDRMELAAEMARGWTPPDVR